MELRTEDGRVIAYEEAGDRGAAPVLLCHGLADSRLSVQSLLPEARELGLRLISPDRPGIGGTERRRLGRLGDWAQDAARILDALGLERAALLGVSGGGPYAAACAALIPGRVTSLLLVAPLGAPGWPTAGMAASERLALRLAAAAPEFGGWAMGALAGLARSAPGAFLRLTEIAQPGADVDALRDPAARETFLTSYTEAFAQGWQGVAQDLRLLTRPWGFELSGIAAPTQVLHGDADITVPLEHSRRYAAAIPGAQLRVFPGDGHFSIFSHARDVLAGLAG